MNNNTYLQLKRSTINLPPNLLFGELCLSDINNIIKLFIGKSDTTVQKIFDSSDSINNYIYNNNYHKYISPNGNDDNNGQVDQKYLTIIKGLNNILSNGIITLECGYYDENCLLNNDHSQKSIVGSNKCYLNGIFQITSSCEKMEFINLYFNNSLLNNESEDYIIKIDSNSLEQNFIFNNIIITNDVNKSNIIKILNNGSGNIDIINSNFNNKILYLSNSTLPRLCFIRNSKNIMINSGTNWIVFTNNCSNIKILSSNNNIYNDDSCLDIINNINEITIDGVYISNINNLTENIDKGDLFIKQGDNYILYEKYYNAKSLYYIILKNESYVKSNNEYKKIASYPIIL